MKTTTAPMILTAMSPLAKLQAPSRAALFFGLALGSMPLQCAKPTVTDASTITITSKRATCQQDKANKKQFTLTYEENVNVSFSEGGQASASKMVVLVDTEQPAEVTSNAPKTDAIKQITLTDNVSFSQEGRKAKADEALFLPEKKQCILTGNVHITQKAAGNKGIPMSVDCSKAALDLVSGNVRLLGSETKPVATTLILDKKTAVFQPAKQKPLVQAHAQHPAPVAKRSA